MGPEALILDSGMRNLGGHNFSYTSAVRQALERRGYRVEVLVNRGFPAEPAERERLRPFFSCGAYDFPLGHGRWRDLVYLHAQSLVRREELEHAFRCVLKRDFELVFCHTVADFELLGWSRYLARAPFSGVLAILLRNTPRFSTRSRLWRTLNPYWRLKPKTLARLRRRLNGRFLLCTDSEALSEDYARVYTHRIVTLPIPIDAGLLEASRPTPGSVSTRYRLERKQGLYAGYLGDARPAKGFDLLPGLIRSFLGSECGASLRVVVQCPSAASGDDSGRLGSELEELRALATDGRVTLVPEKLSRADYTELLQALDIVLIPYTDPTYREATSGIFAEAVALAKPVIVPRGTWMARELARSGAGREFRPEDPADLFQQLLELVRGFESYAEKAARFAPEWRAFHSAERLTDMLLREVALLAVRR